MSKQESNHIETPEEMLLVARVKDEQLKSDDWFLDSSCSNRMCNRKECFANFNEQFVDNVKLGNNAILVVKGKGNVRLQINNQIQFSDHSQRDPQSLLLENPTISPSLPPQHTPSLPLQKEKLPVNKRNLTGKLLRVTEQPTFHPKLKPPLEPTAPTSTPQK